MNQQRNKYNGEIDKQTKLRDGFGIYQYDNQFFQYQGQYNQGQKYGKGKLLMKDGSVFEGEFINGEIEGYGEIQYKNGNYFKGYFKKGNKDGDGELLFRGDLYIGQFKDNCKEGQGEFRKYNGDVIKGQFKNNMANGLVEISYSNGNIFKGKMVNNLKQGEGYLYIKENQKHYQGNFEKDECWGQGKEWYDDIDYVYEGQYVEGKKQSYANQIVIKDLSEQNFEYDIGSKPLQLKITFQFRGQDILDPVQPTQEEIQALIDQFQKENKKNKVPLQMPDFYAPKMISATPVTITDEQNRLVQMHLFQYQENVIDYLKDQKEFLLDYAERLERKREDNQRLKQQLLELQNEETNGNVEKSKKKDQKAKQLLSQQINIEDLELTKLYEEICEERVEDFILKSDKGEVELNAVEFPHDFPPNKYVLVIRDITNPKVGPLMPLILKEIQVKSNLDKNKPIKKK